MSVVVIVHIKHKCPKCKKWQFELRTTDLQYPFMEYQKGTNIKTDQYLYLKAYNMCKKCMGCYDCKIMIKDCKLDKVTFEEVDKSEHNI